MGQNRIGVVVTVALGVLFTWSNAFAGEPPAAVPEPGSLVLLTAGLGGLAWWLRKRR